MSLENVELLGRGLAAWQRDDFDSWLATLDLTVEWNTGLERLVEGTEAPASGVATESPLGMVVTIRGGKIIRSDDYFSHREALEAAGLEE